ncbi:PEP-CTERM sorting domain-containing protein [Accumulibacter sp.]|uniref:PEP-CTERM sorting domain-containing protein n=1 Tax=Accumulibacter sp. TaxID=2053492 RepID=UPI00260DD999|nr:PEP-CTERM sorting domain-containing protein [Accumulibacter sp.]
MKRTIALAIATLAATGSLPTAAFTIDGNLVDWGVNHTTWVPSPGIEYAIDDQVGAGAYYLNPGWGGQAYDAEALYAKIADGRLYIALATGHNPRTVNNPGANSYGAGDFAIDFRKDGTFDLGINIKQVNSVARGGAPVFESFGVEGGVYKDPTWAYGLWDKNGHHTSPESARYAPDMAHPTHLLAGTAVGLATLAYTTSGQPGYGANPGDRHYFYEMSVDLALLRSGGWHDGEAFDIHWTENCANDSIFVDPPGIVPEPATLALMGLGFCGLVSRRGKEIAPG